MNLTKYFRTRTRRRQGMTEYVIIVGLIAIALIMVVRSFAEQIDVTIQGSDGKGGMAGGMNSKVTGAMDKAGEEKDESTPANAPRRLDGIDAEGNPIGIAPDGLYRQADGSMAKGNSTTFKKVPTN